MDKIIIATRASALALWQAEHIKSLIEESQYDIEVELNKITSKGDKILDRPLALIGGKGHFTKELEDAMLCGEAHLAVHSLKDVPTYIPQGLELAAITKRGDQSDAFLSHKYRNIEELPKGAVVGTTSLRRRMQLLNQRPDVKVKELRGNVNTRLKKLKEGEYDAIILAYVGLARLDLLKSIPYVEKLDFMIPPMGQAALGIEIVSNNAFIKKVAQSLNDESSYFCSKLERDFVATIEAGCSAPVAVNANITGDSVVIEAMIGFPDGTHIMHTMKEAKLQKCDNLGVELAQDMINEGALELLKKAEELAYKDEMPQRL
ncbi:MAG: hydroxymethylbilane synthase [Campylobacterales bacterium]|nr:hydroxymethylbilane synthase [Campylobacterales bacterium]